MTAKDDAFARIAGSFAGFFGTWVTSIGKRAGLLAALREHGPLPAAELAALLGYEPRYVETWCRGAYAFELLDHDEGRGYGLAPHVGELLLDATDPSYMGGRAEFFPQLTPDFEMYPARLGDGGLYTLGDRPPEVVQTLASAARADVPNMIANVLPAEPALVAALREGGRVLDAGCGAGYGLAAFAEAFPRSELVGIEIEERQLAAARELLGDRARLERLPVTELPFRDEFDLVYANISLSHTWGAVPEVFGAFRRVLRPGGFLCVSDVPYPERLEELRSPAGRLFTGVTVYVSLLGFRLLSPPQLVELMREVGFEEARIVAQPARTRMMALGRRPA